MAAVAELRKREAWERLSFPETAVIGEVEEVFRKYYAAGTEPENLELDFSNSSYVEIATLQYVIALVLDRNRRGLSTELLFPAGNDKLNTRHFLRRWEFGAAVEEATGLNFRKVVAQADVEKYFKTPAGRGDPGDPYAGVQISYSGRFGEKIYPKDAYRFFGFTTWKIGPQTSRSGLIENAKQRWEQADQSVIETLKKQLRRPAPVSAESIRSTELDSETYVVSRIVFEAMTNAIRHPGASLIQASSHMAQKPIRDPSTSSVRWVDHFLTIVFWDDGQSMFETLRRALVEGQRIHHPTEIRASYLTAFDNHDRDIRRPAMRKSSDIPDELASDEEFLISTLYPGTTSDVRGATLMIEKSTAQEDDRLVKPGMGLHVLLSTAINIFGGSVSFRTGRYFMNVTGLTKHQWPYYRKEYGIAAAEKPDYRVTISSFPRQMPSFLGNLITVRLPLSPEEA